MKPDCVGHALRTPFDKAMARTNLVSIIAMDCHLFPKRPTTSVLGYILLWDEDDQRGHWACAAQDSHVKVIDTL